MALLAVEVALERVEGTPSFLDAEEEEARPVEGEIWKDAQRRR